MLHIISRRVIQEKYFWKLPTLTMVYTERKTMMVEYRPQYVSAKKAPMSGVKKQVPIQADTFLAASALLSWSTVVR